MRALLTILFLSLAICLMAQGSYGKRPGEIDTAKHNYRFPVEHEFASSLGDYNMNSFIFQNEHSASWEARVGTSAGIPHIDLYGEWFIQYDNEKAKLRLVPKHYTIIPMAILPFDASAVYELKTYDELAPMEKKVAINKLLEYLEALLGIYKIPSEAGLEKLLVKSPAFEYIGSSVECFGIQVKHYRYTGEAVALLLEALK